MSNRRIPRSRRAMGAVALLLTAVVVAVVGIVVATVPVLIAATLYAVVAGVVAARLLSDEVAQLRRDWARDRAELADGNRTAAVARSREHIAFAEQMGQRVSLRDAQIATLRDAIVTAEIELAQARERVSAERARSAALESDASAAQSDLESARVDLRRASDALAASESAELQVRAELLAWEEAASEEARRQHDRKLA
ncbi:hypothetical protein [Aeromicrobium fastidiosum]|uniref:Uncharacterized protein n=1 Tax=Aeromicrobium fastidiosum TaxID=52699 RepID=A0A641AH33_9ACTN|nr:hypothetical protein [Aeromicrobium fastidiosum]KAA1372987.1 hypothetical protein ESP62_018010 [Aeromicrobium fastidiosum]MBP2390959.1 chromosome segregation ATPase [Aeromicrobium fastidiosum]